ncbi:hypothetical protein PI126_g15394 [Phytophthora idaei]|nr:hypothetical protein PI126_g15394 [Phytophthora idaei]
MRPALGAHMLQHAKGVYRGNMGLLGPCEAGQCDLFRNFQDLAKFVRIKGTKEELPSELKSVV